MQTNTDPMNKTREIPEVSVNDKAENAAAKDNIAI